MFRYRGISSGTVRIMDVDRELGLPLLFNGLVEVAARQRAILNSCWPHSFTVEELRRLDYFAVFARDAEGPRHLHPALCGRGLSHDVREKAVVSSLEFLMACGDVIADPSRGGHFLFDGDRVDMSGLVSSSYMLALIENTDWMRNGIERQGRDGFLSALDGFWPGLDRTLDGPSDEEYVRFKVLHSIYSSDLNRLEAIGEMAFLFAIWLERQPPGKPSGTLPERTWFERVEAAARAETIKISVEMRGLERMLADMEG